MSLRNSSSLDATRATVRFYGDLADLAWGVDRGGEAHVPVLMARSVKDVVESCGVPHTEVDFALLDGRPVGWGEHVRAGARLSVYPPFTVLDVDSPLRPRTLAEPAFVLDVHLGRLAELLRLLGLDVLYRNDVDDEDLAALAASRPRWLLTRDRGLLIRSAVTHGYLVRATDPREQALEVIARFGLRSHAPSLRAFVDEVRGRG